MGAQPCSLTPNSKNTRILDVEEANIEMEEQFDNPSRGISIKILNNRTITASNDLLTEQQFKCSAKRHKSLGIYNKISGQALRREQNNSQRRGKQQGRCSMDYRLLGKMSGDPSHFGNLLLLLQDWSINSNKLHSIPQKKLYQNYHRAQINIHNFIKLKHAPVKTQYKFQEKIGEGSYGNVYRATCVKTKQERAIKSVQKKTMHSYKRNQFVSQMQILRQLDHPNIIKLFQVFEDNSMYHVVTEYCLGGSIVDYVVLRKDYSEEVSKTIFEQLLSAINYIHHLKIVHRDLKLQNFVFLNHVDQYTEAGEIQIKLIDFGTAARVNNEINFCKTLIGTTSYMAPQIIDGFFNEKCDMWSAGIILYILLVGKSPFKCRSKQETLKKIKNHQLKFTGPEWNSVSRLAIDLLQKLLVKDPQKRISACEASGHEWFKEVKLGESLAFQNRELVQDLSKYYRGNNFISKIESYLAFAKVSQEQRRKISQMFRLLDRNNNGTIQAQQLRVAYDHSQGAQNIEQLQHIVSKIDRNKSGKIDLSQFTAAIYDRRKLFSWGYLEDAFQYFDSDGTGFIDRQELHSLLEGCQKQQVQSILKQIDSDGDSQISKDQFLQYFIKSDFLNK